MRNLINIGLTLIVHQLWEFSNIFARFVVCEHLYVLEAYFFQNVECHYVVLGYMLTRSPLHSHPLTASNHYEFCTIKSSSNSKYRYEILIRWHYIIESHNLGRNAIIGNPPYLTGTNVTSLVSELHIIIIVIDHSCFSVVIIDPSPLHTILR